MWGIYVFPYSKVTWSSHVWRKWLTSRMCSETIFLLYAYIKYLFSIIIYYQVGIVLFYLFMFIYLFLLFNNMLCATFIHISWALWNIIVYSFLWQATTRRSYLEVHEFNGNFKGMQVRFRVTSVIGHVFRYFKNLCTLFPLDIYQCTWA